jgi:hypothetical protein
VENHVKKSINQFSFKDRKRNVSQAKHYLSDFNDRCCTTLQKLRAFKKKQSNSFIKKLTFFAK